MSDSSSVQLYYVEETTWGSTPASALTELRFTQESLKQTTETATSEEIRSDRMVADIVRTSVAAGGEVGVELSYGAHDDLLEGLLSNDWSATVSNTATFTFSTNSPNSTGGVSSTGAFASVVVGQYIKFTGTSVATNNGYYLVTAKASNDAVTISPAAPSASAIAGRMQASQLKNGITKKSYTVEKHFSDLSPAQFQAYTGMRVGSGELTIEPGSIINGNFAFEGKQGASSGTTVGTGPTVASASNDVMNAVDNIGNVLINGAAATGVNFLEISLSVDAKPRQQPAIGSLASVGIGLGRFEITGTLNSYFLNRTMFDRYTNYTAFSLSFTATDGEGNSYLYHFPSVRITDGEASAGGNDEDVVAELEFACRRDPTLNYMFAINRFPA
jgi:hypothetical protein